MKLLYKYCRAKKAEKNELSQLPNMLEYFRVIVSN